MNADEKQQVRLQMKLKVHESDGLSYENLFCSIMELGHKGFKRVKPQGNIGDRKNDGFIPNDGIYYQVYAPEDAIKRESEAITKARNDFEGLLIYWNEISTIRKYYFVLNDKFHGAYPTTYQELANIKRDHNLEETGVFLASDLIDELFNLTDDEIFSIVGNVPAPEKISRLDYSIIDELTDFIKNSEIQRVKLEDDRYIKFEEKIEFNELSQFSANHLLTANYYSGQLDKFFSLNGISSKHIIQEKLNAKYQELLEKDFPKELLADEFSKSDFILNELVSFVTSNKSLDYINSAYVILSYFFEVCDIFEKPV